MKKRNGYALLLLVTLISVISIAGATYYLTSKRSNLKDVTTNVQTDNALNCAESGVDIAVDCLNDAIANGTWESADCTVSEFTTLDPATSADDTTVCKYKSEVKSLTDSIYLPILQKDKTEVILLNAGVNDIDGLQISWKSKDTLTPKGDVLEVNLVKEDSSSSNKLLLDQTDYSCNFTQKIELSGVNASDFVQATLDGDTCSLSASPIDVTGYKFAQITARYNDAVDVKINLTATAGEYPVQGYEISSTGKLGEAVRDVKAIFLYSARYGLARLINNAVYAKSYVATQSSGGTSGP